MNRLPFFSFSESKRFQDIIHKPIRSNDEASYNRIPTGSKNKKKIIQILIFFLEYLQDLGGIVKRRRLQSKYFEMEEEKKKDYQIFVDSYTDVVIEMELFMDHLSLDCQKIDAIMNYYQVSYKRVNFLGGLPI